MISDIFDKEQCQYKNSHLLTILFHNFQWLTSTPNPTPRPRWQSPRTLKVKSWIRPFHRQVLDPSPLGETAAPSADCLFSLIPNKNKRLKSYRDSGKRIPPLKWDINLLK